MYLDWTPWLSLTIGLALAALRPEALPAAVPLLALWTASKPLSQWLNRPAFEPPPKIANEDESFLRGVALRTWRFFRQFSTAEMKWLIPDNVQEAPFTVTAKLSPTNLGLLLTARLAAYQFGYLTAKECAKHSAKTLGNAQQLPRYKGHFFNWYDIRTSKPLEPFFVSTVDSGNLAGCLWTLKQACLEMPRHRLLRTQLWRGIHDHLDLLAQLLEQEPDPTVSAETFSDVARRLKRLSETSSLPWQAWSSIEEEIIRIAGYLLSERSDSPQEIRGWAEELLKRLRAVRETIEDFVPWLLPEYGRLLECSELQFARQVEGLTLELLPGFLTKMDHSLEKLLCSSETESQIRAAAESLRALLPICLHKTTALTEKLRSLAKDADRLVEEMDFRFLCNHRRRLLSVGFDVANRALVNSCYDMLASEARMAVFIAVAKGDLRQESWIRMGRAHTVQSGEPVLLSWAGSMFEYLMPSLWMKSYPNTLLEHTLRAVVKCQKDYAKRHRIPWGISEAAYSKRDERNHYQYRAFGLPDLAVKRTRQDSIVVAPYATALALTVDPIGALDNLRSMREMQWLDKFGFYDSADYTRAEIGAPLNREIVRCWMVHHQGMTLASLCNFLSDGFVQRLFHKEPLVAANERILHERLPKSISVDATDELRLAATVKGQDSTEFCRMPAAAFRKTSELLPGTTALRRARAVGNDGRNDSEGSLAGAECYEHSTT
jgi:hypothetical protein